MFTEDNCTGIGDRAELIIELTSEPLSVFCDLPNDNTHPYLWKGPEQDIAIGTADALGKESLGSTFFPRL